MFKRKYKTGTHMERIGDEFTYVVIDYEPRAGMYTLNRKGTDDLVESALSDSGRWYEVASS